MTPGAPFPFERSLERTSKPLRAVVLEGGGARGAFQAGVLWYLHNHNMPVDVICGTSVGALNAAAFAFGKTDELVRLWSRLLGRDVYRRRPPIQMAWDVFRRRFKHLYDNAPLRALLEDVFGDRMMSDSPIPLLVSAFGLQSGDVNVFHRESPIRVVDALLASSAVQGLFPPYQSPGGGEQFIDGSNGLHLPLAPALAARARDLILVRSTFRNEFHAYPFQDLIAIQKRAYTAMVSRTTDSDLSRATEISHILTAWELQINLLASTIRSTVSSEEEQKTLLESLDQLPSLLEGKHPVRLRVIQPPQGFPLPELLDFNPAVSLQLLRMGYERAHQMLEGDNV